MRISDWSSDVCSSDLRPRRRRAGRRPSDDGEPLCQSGRDLLSPEPSERCDADDPPCLRTDRAGDGRTEPEQRRDAGAICAGDDTRRPIRSEEHTSERQSLLRISYAVICLKKKKSIKGRIVYKPTTRAMTRRVQNQAEESNE